MTDTTIHGLIRRRALEGASLEAIDKELIESDRALDEEHRSALWLYAHHHTQAATRRGAGSRKQEVPGHPPRRASTPV